MRIHKTGFHLDYNSPMTYIPGKQLKQIREARGISLEEIAQKTHIRLSYLEALESGDAESLSSRPQMRGFLRLYASELGVELEDLEVNRDRAIQADPSSWQEEPTPQPDNSPIDLTNEPVAQPMAEPTPQPEAESDLADSVSSAGLETQTYSAPLENQYNPKYHSSMEIFNAVGEKLRTRRELLSLSLEDIHNNIHVRIPYLVALETGHLDELPSPVQAKGMLANYAEFLNLDVDALLLDYADGLQLQRLEKQVPLQNKTKPSAKELSKTGLRLKNFFSIDLLVIAAIFIGFAVFVIWGVNRILDVDTPEAASTELPEVADVLLATGSPTSPQTVTPNGTPNGESLENTPENEAPLLFTPAPNNSPINVVIIPRQRVWVEVTSDSETVFTGRLLPGNAYDYSGDETLEVLTGNAGALQIYFNDQDIGSPGLIGQVVNLIFTENGLVLPTPTITPTITQTPENTPSPTVTPSQTSTPEPSPTPLDNND